MRPLGNGMVHVSSAEPEGKRPNRAGAVSAKRGGGLQRLFRDDIWAEGKI